MVEAVVWHCNMLEECFFVREQCAPCTSDGTAESSLASNKGKQLDCTKFGQLALSDGNKW